MLCKRKKETLKLKNTELKPMSISDPNNPTVLIEGVLFRAKYLGSTQLISEAFVLCDVSETDVIISVEYLHSRFVFSLYTGNINEYLLYLQAPEGENQPSTEVDLFVSTEKIMVLNTDLQEIMMDHSLRTISYIADIGEIIVIMARRRVLSSPGEDSLRRKKQAKILCHVFESEEVSFFFFDFYLDLRLIFQIGPHNNLFYSVCMRVSFFARENFPKGFLNRVNILSNLDPQKKNKLSTKKHCSIHLHLLTRIILIKKKVKFIEYYKILNSRIMVWSYLIDKFGIF
ncbi:hypothetical protein KUTeg_017461 [Tegillarca granosa]|uniref:PID domain-containing protein n=1 Tax=Tegillarca granosa TaxID=220873 RepID=A0ABQ9EEY8_TEGGR|nr:hypothetical protein KUTeg_017461 [Tegillarca granosa]